MANDKEFNEFLHKALEETIADGYKFMGEVETLLDVPQRKRLPHQFGKPGPKSKLEQLVLEEPATYKAYIDLLMRGAYYHTAAESVGIPERSIVEWGKKGKKDYYAELDTYYSRFYKDVRRAVACVRTAIEITMVKLDPKKWLSKGPGKMFGQEWADERNEELEALEEVPFEAQKVIEQVNTDDGVETMMVKLSPETEEATIEVLQEVLNKRRNDASPE